MRSEIFLFLSHAVINLSVLYLGYAVGRYSTHRKRLKEVDDLLTQTENLRKELKAELEIQKLQNEDYRIKNYIEIGRRLREENAE